MKFALSNENNHRDASEYAMNIKKLVPLFKDKSIKDLLTELVDYFKNKTAFFHLGSFKDGYIAHSENTIYHVRNISEYALYFDVLYDGDANLFFVAYDTAILQVTDNKHVKKRLLKKRRLMA